MFANPQRFKTKRFNPLSDFCDVLRLLCCWHGNTNVHVEFLLVTGSRECDGER